MYIYIYIGYHATHSAWMLQEEKKHCMRYFYFNIMSLLPLDTTVTESTKSNRFISQSLRFCFPILHILIT